MSIVLEDSAFSTLPTGKILIEAQAAGVVTKYQVDSGGNAYGPSDILVLKAQLLNLHDRAIAPISQLFVQGYGQGLTDDAQIFAWMLAQLQVVNTYNPDFSTAGINGR